MACWSQCCKSWTCFIWSLISVSGANDVRMDKTVLEEKLSFKMLGLLLFFKFDWDSYIVSIAKIAYKKIWALILSMKFLPPEVALYPYKSTIQPCLKYFYHVWVGAPSCYLDTWIC